MAFPIHANPLWFIILISFWIAQWQMTTYWFHANGLVVMFGWWRSLFRDLWTLPILASYVIMDSAIVRECCCAFFVCWHGYNIFTKYYNIDFHSLSARDFDVPITNKNQPNLYSNGFIKSNSSILYQHSGKPHNHPLSPKHTLSTAIFPNSSLVAMKKCQRTQLTLTQCTHWHSPCVKLFFFYFKTRKR